MEKKRKVELMVARREGDKKVVKAVPFDPPDGMERFLTECEVPGVGCRIWMVSAAEEEGRRLKGGVGIGASITHLITKGRIPFDLVKYENRRVRVISNNTFNSLLREGPPPSKQEIATVLPPMPMNEIYSIDSELGDGLLELRDYIADRFDLMEAVSAGGGVAESDNQGDFEVDEPPLMKDLPGRSLTDDARQSIGIVDNAFSCILRDETIPEEERVDLAKDFLKTLERTHGYPERIDDLTAINSMCRQLIGHYTKKYDHRSIQQVVSTLKGIVDRVFETGD
ncbi:MAG: hypothetical protein ABH851_07225 [Methanobacteriota archaeon]